MNNLAQTIADIFAPLTTAQKMRVNLDTEQVFSEKEQVCSSCALDTEVDRRRGEIAQEIAPYLAKIPIRAEYRDILAAAEAYEHNARAHDEEAERLRTLAGQAREQADKLKRLASL